jgi:acyl dehydratase
MSLSVWSAEIGTTFEGRPRNLSLDRILAFSGGLLSEPNWPHKNLHTDVDKAREAGLLDIIASGNQSVGILVALLMRLFGSAWLHNGVLDMKIVKSVYAGDTVQAKATLTERRDVAGAVEFVLDAWCDNQHGATVVAGTALCRLATRPR